MNTKIMKGTNLIRIQRHSERPRLHLNKHESKPNKWWLAKQIENKIYEGLLNRLQDKLKNNIIYTDTLKKNITNTSINCKRN